MSNQKSPAFQFYPKDLLSDGNVILMSNEEIGMYMLLMSVCWLEGSLPDNEKDLAKIARATPKKFKKSWESRIKKCFDKNKKNDWIHPRLEKERDRQKNYKNKKAAAGRKGAEKRWQDYDSANGKDENKNGSAIAVPENKNGSATDLPMAKNSSSSSSPSSTTDPPSGEKRPHEEPERIEPPQEVDKVIEIGNMKGVPPKSCELYFDMRSTDNFYRQDQFGNWKPILNWHSDLVHQYQRGNLESIKRKTNGNVDTKSILEDTEALFEND